MIARGVRYLRRRVRDRIDRHRPLILMYHRVAEPQSDEWQLAVSPDRFAEQVAALVATRTVVPLKDILTARSDRPLAAVTFDDGYADVLETALPILERHDCRATLFLVTDAVGSQGFWWDRLEAAIMHPRVDGVREVSIPEAGISARVDANAAPAQRSAEHKRLWAALRPLDEKSRDRALDRLCEAAHLPAHGSATGRIASADAIRKLSGSLLDIGAHTLSHPTLPALDPVAQKREIEGSRDACEALTGQRPRTFGYPFGDYDAGTPALVAAAGFDLAVSVRDGFVRPDSSRYTLPRRAVTNAPIERFVASIGG